MGDLADHGGLEALLAERRFDAVVHCAAHIWVGELVRDPVKYYANNTANAIRLFEPVRPRTASRTVVFSSTAAVYGQPEAGLIDESLPLAPINPYGASKMMAERVLVDIAAATGLRYAILRYFNVAGADRAGADRRGHAGQRASGQGRLRDRASACGPACAINGTDYPTPDGTCVRDYVHVDDLARAHLAGARPSARRAAPRWSPIAATATASACARCWTRRGASPASRFRSRRARAGRATRPCWSPTAAASRRCSAGRPRHDDLDYIVATAWRWEQRLRAMRADR